MLNSVAMSDHVTKYMISILQSPRSPAVGVRSSLINESLQQATFVFRDVFDVEQQQY